MSPRHVGLCEGAWEGTESSMGGWHPCPFAGHAGGTLPFSKGQGAGGHGQWEGKEG